jgi:outer membrane protein assembly factor BamE
MNRRLFYHFFPIFLLLFVTACRWIPVYQNPVAQGQNLNLRSIHQLKIGMTEEEVCTLLGSPVLQDPCDLNLWHYIYTMTKKPGTEKPVYKELQLRFYNHRLTAIPVNTF